MFDHEAIADDLRLGNLTHGQIAAKHGCSCKTVTRVVTEYGLYRGRGVRHVWKYRGMSPELAYVIGIYLTDGHLASHYHQGTLRALIVKNTSQPLLERFRRSLISFDMPASWSGPHKPGGEKGYLPQWRVSCYSSLFARWLNEICSGKASIPIEVISADPDSRLAFLEGVIDGDGSVRTDGTIRVRGIHSFVCDLPEFLESLDIRHTGCTSERTLPNDKPYWRVYVRRSDFRNLNPHLAVPLKHNRMMFAKDLRHVTHS